MFWLYVTVMEQLLPLNYYSNMIEAAMVMSKVFDFLLSKLDEKSH